MGSRCAPSLVEPAQQPPDLRFIAAEGTPLACCGCSSWALAGKPFGQLLPPATAEYVKSQYQHLQLLDVLGWGHGFERNVG